MDTTQNDPTQEPVQDADVVVPPEEIPTVNNATMLLELESMIKSNLTGIDTRKDELKKTREMIASVLTNDETYKTHEKQAKEANKIKNATKQQLLKLTSNAQLVAKMHELSAEIKEMSDALSEYLREYGKMSGTNEIETDDGTVREIVFVAKLIKKTK